jgi:hypothetical protein
MCAFLILRPQSTLVGQGERVASQEVPAEVQDLQGVILAKAVRQEEPSLVGQLVPVQVQ